MNLLKRIIAFLENSFLVSASATRQVSPFQQMAASSVVTSLDVPAALVWGWSGGPGGEG